MKRYLIGIVFCGGLWGLCEAVLGGWLYAADYRQAAPVVLSAVAFAVLTVGRLRMPFPGSSAAIAALAMLFKFFNQPFFACHLLGIFLLGASFDVAWTLARGRAKPIIGAAATYLGFALFAVTITYVFRYEHWIAEGWRKVLWYVGVTGTIAGACNAVIVPLAAAADARVRALFAGHSARRTWVGPVAVAVSAAMWAMAFIVHI